MRESTRPPAVTPCRGSSPSARNCGANCSTVACVNPPKETGVAISIILASPAETWDCLGNSRVRSVSVSETAARRAGSAAAGETRSISSIGRMPAMASVANGNAMATAPTSRPSMNTGLPLIPCMTPVLASGPPESRPRISDCLGPIFSRTPRISTSNSSIRSPENTVLPMPRIPGLDVPERIESCLGGYNGRQQHVRPSRSVAQ